jgi:hypothetical protein
MDSGMIGKIQKAKRYAESERDRFHIESFVIRVDGTNNQHTVTFENNQLILKPVGSDQVMYLEKQ